MLLYMTMDLGIDETTKALLEREREVINELNVLLGRLNADREDLKKLKHALRDLEGVFMLVVCGEYNAGKSTFLNALLGEKVMLEGVTPTTDRIAIVTHGETERTSEEDRFILRRQHPAEALRELALVDTPGTNAVITQHQELTENFIPRADLILFVTSTDRPFTESERRFLDLIRSWGKKIIIIVNKIDILESDEEQAKVLEFVEEQAKKALDITAPLIFGLAAKKAYQAKISKDQQALDDSGIVNIERYIQENVVGTARLVLKMKTPLGVGLKLAGQYGDVIYERLKLLENDKRTLEEVERQHKQFDHDMKRDFQGHLARIKDVLLEVERRGEVFFDDTVRLGRVLKLIKPEKIKNGFEAEVIRGADQKIDKSISNLVDWFIQRNMQLWEDVMIFVKERRKAGNDQVIGEVGGRFQYNRGNLIHNLEESAGEVLEGYDEKTESAKLASNLQGAVLRGGLMQLGGLGLGAALAAMLSGLALDVTGVVAGLAVVGMGFLVLPNQRRKAKKDLHHKMQELRDGLEDNLGKQFELELSNSSEKLRNAISPYTRFVHSELGHLEELKSELSKVKESLQMLRQEIEALQ